MSRLQSVCLHRMRFIVKSLLDFFKYENLLSSTELTGGVRIIEGRVGNGPIKQ